ncbi:hypothetical protein [Sphaerisporangium flaviroseum]|uniref:hypothetical protein n=1 Tax=Sphaerisporangium flaviroseum TaxID=509199 RepID=UPI0031EC6EB7
MLLLPPTPDVPAASRGTSGGLSPPAATASRSIASSPAAVAAGRSPGAGTAADPRARWLNLDSGIPPEYLDLIIQAGTMCDQPGLSPVFIAAVLNAESGFDPNLSDPDLDEYGIARWTPRVLRHWQPGGLSKPEPRPPYSPELSIPAMGKFFCRLGPQIASIPGDPAMNLVGLYRTSVTTVRQYNGVPPQWSDHAYKVKRYMNQYNPR